MASGILGKADLAATTYTTIYTVATDGLATVNISVCNRNTASVKIRLALAAATGTPDDSEFIEYDTSISANGVLERTGVVIGSEIIITAYSDTADVTVIAYGMEG
jgi:hypothetical protein